MQRPLIVAALAVLVLACTTPQHAARASSPASMPAATAPAAPVVRVLHRGEAVAPIGVTENTTYAQTGDIRLEGVDRARGLAYVKTWGNDFKTFGYAQRREINLADGSARPNPYPDGLPAMARQRADLIRRTVRPTEQAWMFANTAVSDELFVELQHDHLFAVPRATDAGGTPEPEPENLTPKLPYAHPPAFSASPRRSSRSARVYLRGMALSTVRGAVARTFAALLALAASGCNSSSTPSNLAEGAACTEHHECGSQICYQGRCSAGRDGAPCTSGIYITGCATGFTCLDKTCLGPERLAALEAAKEHELLERSGVEVAARTPVVEQPAPPAAGPGARIRVVSIKAKGSAFASCRGDERLTGGSCTGWNLKENGPTRFGPDDTMGARWSCRAVGPEVELTAVALCASTR